MSKVWAYGKGWTDTGGVQESLDMPGALVQQPELEQHLPKGWVLCSYGIPQSQSGMRRQLCSTLKSHGLQSFDKLPGSVYFGPENTAMDQRVRGILEKLRTKLQAGGWVKFVKGDFDEATAAMFLDSVTKRTFEELQTEEQKMAQLERALAGQEKIVNRDGKEQDLLTTGYGRVNSAREAIEQADAVLARFQGNAALEAEGERLRMRTAQVRAWIGQVAQGFARFAAVERARRKAAEGAA